MTELDMERQSLRRNRLTREEAIKALRRCARREECTNCPMIAMNTAVRKGCFTALMLRAAELLEEAAREG